MQLQILNCITRAGPKPTLKNSSGTRRYYIDLQLNIIGHQLNYYWSDKVLDISYLYFRGLGRMNVNLFNASICLAQEGGVLLLYSEAVKDLEDWLFNLSLTQGLGCKNSSKLQNYLIPTTKSLVTPFSTKKQTQIISFNWFHSQECVLLKKWWFNRNEGNSWHLSQLLQVSARSFGALGAQEFTSVTRAACSHAKMKWGGELFWRKLLA